MNKSTALVVLLFHLLEKSLAQLHDGPLLGFRFCEEGSMSALWCSEVKPGLTIQGHLAELTNERRTGSIRNVVRLRGLEKWESEWLGFLGMSLNKRCGKSPLSNSRRN